MKKLTTIFAALTLLISSSAFAAPTETVTKEVKIAFEKNFTDAVNVTWEKTSDFYFANFILDNVNINAAYNEEGELIGVARKIDLSQLPLNVSQALKYRFDGYTFRNNVTEIVFDGETNYYVTADGDSRVFNLKCSADGQINIEKKSKKKVLVGRVM